MFFFLDYKLHYKNKRKCTAYLCSLNNDNKMSAHKTKFPCKKQSVTSTQKHHCVLS